MFETKEDNMKQKGFNLNESAEPEIESPNAELSNGIEEANGLPIESFSESGLMVVCETDSLVDDGMERTKKDGNMENVVIWRLYLQLVAIINGYIPNAVPLKYFKQFPDHVATGFAYLQNGMINVAPPVTSVPLSSSNATVPQDETQTANATSAAYLVSDQTLPPQTNSNDSISDQLTLNQEEVDMLASILSLGSEHACCFWWMVRVKIMDHILYRRSIIGSSTDIFQMQP